MMHLIDLHGSFLDCALTAGWVNPVLWALWHHHHSQRILILLQSAVEATDPPLFVHIAYAISAGSEGQSDVLSSLV